MTFFEKVSTLCSERGVPISTVAVSVGLSTAIPTKWKKEASVPRPSTVKKIADYFGVPVSFFTENSSQTIHDNHGIIGDTHAPVVINGTSEKALGDIERELLAICGKLDMKRKNALLMRAYELIDEMEKVIS